MSGAALDPGSVHCGLAAGEGIGHPILSSQVEVNGDPAGAAACIVEWVASVGAASLVIEWARYYATGKVGADMARQDQREAQLPMLYAIAAGCRARGIEVATDEAIRKSRGPGLIGVSTWRSTIGAISVKNPETGRMSSKDSAVRAALVRHLGAETVAILNSDHRRDAAGLLLGSWLAPERAAPGEKVDTRKRQGDRHLPKPGRWSSPHRVEYHREDARESYRRKAAAKRAAAPVAPTMAERLVGALGSGPLAQGALAGALGYKVGSLAYAIRPHLAPGGAEGCALVRVPPPGGKGHDWYALAEKSTG